MGRPFFLHPKKDRVCQPLGDPAGTRIRKVVGCLVANGDHVNLGSTRHPAYDTMEFLDPVIIPSGNGTTWYNWSGSLERNQLRGD